MFGAVIFAFATVFGPPKLDPYNPNPSLACARAVFGKPRNVNTKVFAIASYKLPCGARVRVCAGRRCVIARVLDRGPQRAKLSGKHTDDIDLSVAFARALGIGNAQGQAVCEGEDPFRGCPITYTVDLSSPTVNYNPPRS